MRSRVLREGPREYRILDACGAPPLGARVSFPDPYAWQRFVERLLFRADNAVTVRALLRDQAGMDAFSRGHHDDRLADALAGLLWSGRVVLEDVPAVVLSGAAVATEIAAHAPAAPARETTWVGLLVLDDSTGDPVADVKLGITLPRAKRADHTTPGSGALDFDPCEPGACAVDVDPDGASLDSALELVGMGEPSLRPLGGERFPRRDGRPRRVLQVIHHRVRRVDTLDSIARSAGLTWEQLAEFNFGTTDPRGINRALRREVGCSRTTRDRKNYVFDDSDEPGIIFVPQRLALRGLSTGQTHQLRVRPLTRPSRPFLFSC